MTARTKTAYECSVVYHDDYNIIAVVGNHIYCNRQRVVRPAVLKKAMVEAGYSHSLINDTVRKAVHLAR